MSKTLLISICLWQLCITTPALAQSRAQCETWRTQHQRLTELRRAGGTLAEMDRWRDRQRLIEEKMQLGRCLQRFRISPQGNIPKAP